MTNISVKLPINYNKNCYSPNFKSDKKENLFLPLQAAAISTVVWTGVGFGLDYLVLNKIFKSSGKDKKFSNIINILFGVIMGIGTYMNVRKKQREENVQSFDDLTKSMFA